MTPQESHIILHLSLIDGVGPATIAKLGNFIRNNSHDWHMLSRMTASDIAQRCALSLSAARTIVAGLSNNKILEHELALIEKHQISWMTVFDEKYPPLLKQIHTPPALLYWRGTEIPSTESVAVIGSRRANQYGQRVVNRLVPELVSRGVTIVSGGALGADTMAHRAALAAGGATVVVLGSGLLRPYPRENQKMFDAVADGHGAVISSFSLTTTPHPGNFPARNRIIAGLSRACIVVQAAAQSGATIMAQYALDEGRDVYAVPGAFDDELSAGCHALIAQGATLLSNVSDMFAVATSRVSGHDMKSVSTEGVSSHPLRPMKFAGAVPSESTLSDRVMVLCQTPQSLDDLISSTGHQIEQLQDLLFELQLSGRLMQDFTGMWVVS